MTTSSTGAVTSRCGGGGDRVDDDLAGVVSHLAEDRVAVLEVRRRSDGDEELGTVGPRAAFAMARTYG